MSTNFYLHRDPQTFDPFGLTDGLDPDAVHIGKFSGGWAWTWQGFLIAESPAPWALNGPRAWRDYLEEATATGARILDEYASETSLIDLFKRIVSHRGNSPSAEMLVRTHPDWKITVVEGDLLSYGEWS